MTEQVFRTFIAFDFDKETIEKVSKIQQSFRSLNLGKISYTKPEQVHITLSFLGDINLEQINKIITFMKNIKVNQEILFNFNKLDYFPSSKKPRTIVLKCFTEEDTYSLINLFDKYLLEIGIKRDKKWIPHLTLGRAKELFSVPEFTITEFSAKPYSLSLYKSTLQKSGAVHQKLYSLPL